MMSDVNTSGLLPDEHRLSSDRSSSTEGPDSPCDSTSVSPIPPSMMILPQSPSSNQSSIHRYSIRFTDHISKDGDSVSYRLNVRKLVDGADPNRVLTIDRQYDDFEFLHHSITTGNSVEGIIFPPLPPRPATDPTSAENKSKRQLGSNNRTIQGDDFVKDCNMLEKYLFMMISHPILGKDQRLADFLEKTEPPMRTKIKRGFFSGVLQNTMDTRKSVRDLEQDFQRERDWTSIYIVEIKRTRERFHAMVHSQLRVVNQLGHLSAIFNTSVGDRDGLNVVYNRLNGRFSSFLEEEKIGSLSSVSNSECTMGAYLDLYSNYLDSVNAMLLRRTSLMIDYDNASKALVKAKIEKVGMSKIVKECSEKIFRDCSELARSELKRFHQRRLIEMKEALIYYVEGQIKSAREASKGLHKALDDFKAFTIPPINSTGLLE